MSILFSASWRPFGHNLAGQQWSRASLREFKATCSPLHSVQSSLLRWRHSPRNNAESHLILLWPTSRTAFENHWFRALRPSHTAAATQIETSQHATSVLPKPDVKTAFALPARRVNSIFRGSLPAGDGNGLLAKLQIHRQKGTLDAKFDASEEAIEAGLRYLRSRYPMDEDAAVLARVDQELENEIRLPQEKPELSPYAESNLVKIRQENKARHEREAALEVAQAKRLEDTDKKRRQLVAVASADRSVTDPKTKESTGLRPLEEPNRKEAEWVTRYREEAEQTEIPDISTFRRLWPSGVFTVAAVTLSYLFAQNYTPPEKAARIFSESPPAAVTMYAILAANVLVYAAWKTPQLWVALSKFFIIVPLRPKAPSMILAAFSHQDFIHLAQNMFFMWFIGVRLHDNVGRGPFLGLICASAVLGAYVTLTTFVFRNMLFTSTIGASNILCAMIAAQCILHEGVTVKLPFVFDEWTASMNTGVVLAILIAYEIITMWRGGLINPKIVELHGFTPDKAGHLTGYITGTIMGWLYRQHHAEWRDLRRDSFWNRWVPTTEADPANLKAHGSDSISEGPGS